MLRRVYDHDELDLTGGTQFLRDPAQWHAFVDALFETDWVVYAKPAFGGRVSGPPLSRALHPSGRDQQSPAARLRWRPRHVSVEGLCPRRSATHDDALRHGVSAPLRPTHPAARLRTHPAVGVSRQHLSWYPRGAGTDAAHHTIGRGRSHGHASDPDHRHTAPRGRVPDAAPR